jgi:hypothetical protein
MKTLVARCVSPLALSALAFSCSPETITSSTGEIPFYDVTMWVYTAEGDSTRHLLVVGDTGVATITAFAQGPSRGCLASSGVCTYGLDGTLRSSDVGVLEPARESFHGFAQVAVTARAPGAVTLSATIADSVLATRIDVVRSPLPVDSVRVRLHRQAGDSLLGAVLDAAGNVASLTLPVGSRDFPHFAVVRILAFRGGDSTVYLPTIVTSSDSDAVWVHGTCRFINMSDCTSIGWATISGFEVGSQTVTVTARNRQYSFVVMVQ